MFDKLMLSDSPIELTAHKAIFIVLYGSRFTRSAHWHFAYFDTILIRFYNTRSMDNGSTHRL